MANSKKEQNNLNWITIPSMAIGAIMLFFILRSNSKLVDEIERNNKQLPSREITGLVASVSQNRGTIKLRLKNNDIFYFSTTRNYDLEPYDLDDFIQHGDSIYKRKNSMTLEVYRNKQRFEFVLEKRIGTKK